MKYVSVSISGVPYAKSKSRGDRQAPQRWTEAFIDQTKGFPQVSKACLPKATFLFPPDRCLSGQRHLSNQWLVRHTRKGFTAQQPMRG